MNGRRPPMGSLVRRFLLPAAALWFVATGAWFALDVYRPVDAGKESVLVDIPRGTGFGHVTEILDRAGLMKNRLFFRALATLRRATGQIRAGEYEFSGALSPAQILQKLMDGEIRVYRVTIPEDLTAWEIAQRLGSEGNGLVDPEEFLRLSADREFLMSLGLEGESVEGYLFPDTYRFDRSMGSREIIRIMVGRFWKVVTPEWSTLARSRGMTIPQLVTLASMIGKESGNREEKPLIAAVFHNRLQRGMRLQSDPTAIYRLAHPGGKVLKRDLARSSPHNTYQIDGIPPGPIANPGADSIRAALYPAAVDHLYFVSKNDGSHHFSSDFASHAAAVIKYQIARKK